MHLIDDLRREGTLGLQARRQMLEGMLRAIVMDGPGEGGADHREEGEDAGHLTPHERMRRMHASEPDRCVR